MKWGWKGARVRCWRGGATRLLAGAAVAVMLLGGAAAAQQSVVFEGSTFVNQGLVGVARVPSDARDHAGRVRVGHGARSQWLEEEPRRQLHRDPVHGAGPRLEY